MKRLVVVGNPENRRVTLLQAALARQALAPATVVSYEDLLTGKHSLAEVCAPETVVRIESPGENAEVERRLATRGLAECDAAVARSVRLADDGLVMLEHGEILPGALWYAGYRQLLAELQAQAAITGGIRWMSDPEEILRMFDKRTCNPLLAEQGIATTQVLGIVMDYESLVALLEATGGHRVFLKPPHSSSASGVVALQRSPTRVLAWSPLEVQRSDGRVRLFNSLRMRQISSERELAEIVDALAVGGLVVERWMPKAAWQGRTTDVRIVVIDGEPRHTVLRMSRHPMTNLHLGSQRGDVQKWIAELPDGAWQEALATCRRVAAAFPQALYFGVDLAFAPGYRRQAVIEVNAFGDLLPGVVDQGHDTYEAEIVALRRQGFL